MRGYFEEQGKMMKETIEELMIRWMIVCLGYNYREDRKAANPRWIQILTVLESRTQHEPEEAKGLRKYSPLHRMEIAELLASIYYEVEQARGTVMYSTDIEKGFRNGAYGIEETPPGTEKLRDTIDTIVDELYARQSIAIQQRGKGYPWR